MSLSVSPIKDSHGTPIGASKIVRDVTEQKRAEVRLKELYHAAQREIAQRERAEAALLETDRRKDEFLATLAHELRNPLAPIRQAALISKATDAIGTAETLESRGHHPAGATHGAPAG